MIGINELRRLAQAASHPTTKGRWIRLFGERTVYDRMEDGCRGIPVVSTDTHPPSPSEAACLDFIAAANPAVINELLDRLEAAETAWKVSDKSCYDLTEKVIPNLRGQLEVAEKEANKINGRMVEVKKRLQLIVEEPSNTMSNAKAMREMLRQANLALKALK